MISFYKHKTQSIFQNSHSTSGFELFQHTGTKYSNSNMSAETIEANKRKQHFSKVTDFQ
jgi:hypothetical protein